MLTVILAILFILSLYLSVLEFIALMSIIKLNKERNAPDFSNEEVIECAKKILRQFFKSLKVL